MPRSIAIRPESPGDYDAIAEVNRRAFGQQGEGRLVNRLREEGHARLSLVAVDCNEGVVGHILFSRLTIVSTDAAIDALALAPMAVAPELQRQGIGRALVEEGLARCRDAGERIVVVLGHPEYYPRFGFSSELAGSLKSPFGVPAEAWMALELVPDALAGVQGRVEYPSPFADVT